MTSGRAALPGWFPRSLPEWLGASVLVLVPVAAWWGPLTAAIGRDPACPILDATGLRCPACGGVTATRALVEADVAGALAANPVIAGVMVVAGVLLARWGGRLVGVLPPPAPWSLATSRVAGAGLFALIALSWAYQVTLR